MFALALVSPLAAAASCSNGNDSRPVVDVDSGDHDADVDAADAATVIYRDAAPIDAQALPVVCGSGPCATSLVTTLGKNPDEISEGFCALMNDGTVDCWGANGSGQLGRGPSVTADSPTAAPVVGLSDVVDLDHTCAVDKAGATWCWGNGPFLRGDAGANTSEFAPVKLAIPPATAVGFDNFGTACAAVDGGVMCWGSNNFGQIGSMEAFPFNGSFAPQLVPVPHGAPIKKLAVGESTFALREDGRLLTWGQVTLARFSSLEPDPNPEAIGLEGIANIDQSIDNACAAAGGTGYCWGTVVPDSQGNVVNPNARLLPSPVVVPEPVVQMATDRTKITFAGNATYDVQPYRWCAATVSGGVFCHGRNDSGQAGDGTKTYAVDTVGVAGLPEKIAQVRVTLNTTCALSVSGKVYCWGSNENGQLGNGKLKGVSFAPGEVTFP